jgi:hypothetical protein
VTIENTGDVELESLQVNAPKAPLCEEEFEELDLHVLAIGERVDFSCSRPNMSKHIDNEVTVVGKDAIADSQVLASDTAIVRIKNPNIDMVVLPVAGSETILVGSNAVLNVYVENTGDSELRNVAVSGIIRGKDSDEFEQLTACDRDIGTMSFQGPPVEYQCTIADVQQGFVVELVVTALNVASGTTIEAFDVVEINVLALEVEVSSVPFEILNGQPTSVQFNITVHNRGSKDVNLDSLFSKRAPGNPPDPLHGELTDPDNSAVQTNNCAVAGEPPVLPAGGTFACSYTATIAAQPPAYTAVIAATASDNQDVQVSAEAAVILIVSDLLPVEVTLSAAPSILVAPGGMVNLTVQVKNNQVSSLVLQGLHRPVGGSLDGVGTCELPQTISANGSYSCSYQVVVSGKKPGDQLTYSVTATSGGRQYHDDVSVNITDKLHLAVNLPVITLGYVAGEPNNSPCTAQPILINNNIYFLPDDQHDWYRFTLTEQANIVVSLTNHVPRKGQLLLYSGGDCTEPKYLQHDGTVNTPNRVVDLGLQPAGQYLVWVLTDNNFSSTRPYTLLVEVTTP